MRSFLTVIGLGLFVLVIAVACSSDDDEDTPATAPPAPTLPPAQPTAPPPPEPSVFEVGMRDAGGRGPFMFEPADLTFSVGQTVNFSFTSEAVFHTFTVDDLGIDVPVDGGETVQFTFTFDQPGTYELICIPHESLGMVGTITVQ